MNDANDQNDHLLANADENKPEQALSVAKQSESAEPNATSPHDNGSNPKEANGASDPKPEVAKPEEAEKDDESEKPVQKKKTKRGREVLEESYVRDKVNILFEKIQKAISADNDLVLAGKPGKIISVVKTRTFAQFRKLPKK